MQVLILFYISDFDRKNLTMKEKVKIKNFINYPLTICFFAVCIMVFLGYLLMGDTQFSDMENRYLALRPSISLQALSDGSFMQNFENYCNEQVPGRNLLVKAKAGISQLMFMCENDGVAKGSDGYLFEKVTGESPQASKNISAITNFAKTAGERDRDVFIAVAPTSVWINENRLPKGMPVLDEKSLSEKLSESIEKTDFVDKVHVIDLYTPLSEHKNEDLYYRTDHHWTTPGAGYAYEAIMREMGEKPGDISAYDRNTRSDFYGTAYAKYKGVGVNPDSIEYYDVPIEELRLEKRTVYNLYDLDKLDTYDKYAMFMYGNDGCYEVLSGNEGGKIIVLKDSYANCLIPYLTMNFNDIIVVDLRYFGGSVQEMLDSNPDAEILLLYNWSFVNDDNHFYKLVK